MFDAIKVTISRVGTVMATSRWRTTHEWVQRNVGALGPSSVISKGLDEGVLERLSPRDDVALPDYDDDWSVSRGNLF